MRPPAPIWPTLPTHAPPGTLPRLTRIAALGALALGLWAAGRAHRPGRAGRLRGAASPAGLDAVQATLRVCKSGCEYERIQAALDAAEAGDTILVGSGLYPENLIVWRTVRLRGVSATNTAIDGGGEGATLYVPDGVQATISNLTIQNGLSEVGGGIVNLGALTLREVVVSGNRAVGATGGEAGPEDSYGGGIYNYEGSLTLRDSEIRDNEATFGGGIYSIGTTVVEDSAVVGNRATSGGAGIFNFEGTLLVHNSRVGENRVTGQGPGGGVYNYSVVAVSYSLFDDNRASDFGGAIYQRKGGTYISASTLSGNAAGFGGGGVYLLRGEGFVASATIAGNGGSFGGAFSVQEDAELEVINTIVADSPGSNCFGEIDSFGYNLDSGNTCGFDDEDDLFNTDPDLAPLADNGGVTFTHALPATSPAVDMGDFAGCTDFNGYDVSHDQRSRPRHIDGDGDDEVRCDIGAYEFDPAGSGPLPPPDPLACTGITACLGDCDHATIGAAIAAAPAGGTVCVREGLFAERLVIDKDLTLKGAHRELSIVDGGSSGPVLSIAGEHEVVVADLALTDGAGVLNPAGDLTLRDCRVAGHAAAEDAGEGDPQGSGVLNGGQLAVQGCLFEDNLSFGSGGAIDTRSGSATVTDSRFENNTAASRGGAIAAENERLIVRGSVFDGNEAQTGGALSSVGPLLSEGDTFTSNFARFGGAVYAADEATIAQGTFQRNQADLGGGGYLAGEAEVRNSRLFENIATGEFGYGGGLYASDADLSVTGGLINDNFAWNGGGLSAQGDVTLENVTMSGNRARYGGGMIQFDGTTVVRGGVLNSNVGDLAAGAGYLADGELRLEVGAIARDNTSLADAGGFLVTEDATLVVEEADLINNTAEVAGGVLNRGTFLALRARIDSHGASGGVTEETDDPEEEPEERPGRGGALLNEESASATVVASLLSGNGAELGGAIWNAGALGLLNSTISDNGADIGGGGLFNDGGQATLRNVTLANNTADPEAEGGGALRNTAAGGTVTVGHTLIARSASVANCAGPITSAGHNLDDGASCVLAGAGDRSEVDARIAPLADYGGRTPTHDLYTGSPAIDGGDPAGCRDLDDAALTTDQRGAPRPSDGDEDGTAHCDIGAVEHSPDSAPPTPGPDRDNAIFLPWGSR